MKKQLIFLALISLFSSVHLQQINAQSLDSNDISFWDNVRYGGAFGLGFGSGYFDATLSPTAIYNFNQYAAIGSALNFTYAKRDNLYESYVVGISFLGIFSPIPEIQLSVEPQQSFVSRNFAAATTTPDEDYWVGALFLGAGYNMGNVTIGIQYDVLYDQGRSVFSDAWYPFFRVFF